MYRQWVKFSSVCAATVLIGVLAFAALAGPASARDLPSSIANAENRAELANGEVGELKSKVAPAAARYAAVSQRTRPARVKVRAARHRMASLEGRDRARRVGAAARVRRIEGENRKSAEKHDEKVTSGLGIGVGLLVVGLLVICWGWFRATEAVAALTRITVAQAVGICVGGGFLAVLVGAVMQDADGLVAALGAALVVLGLVLPAVFLLARHSAEVQRGRSKPLLRRERFPDRVTQVLAGVFAVFCLIAFGSSLFASGAKSREVPASLRGEAGTGNHQDHELAIAESRALRATRNARPLLAAQAIARSDLRGARRAVGHAERRVAEAKDRAKSFTRQLVALESHEQREYEREERHAQRQQENEEREYQKNLEREEREALVADEEAAEAEACDPNYEGACLHEGIGDYDCAGGSGDGPNYVAGPIYVTGFDEFELDSDGNGVACEDG